MKDSSYGIQILLLEFQLRELDHDFGRDKALRSASVGSCVEVRSENLFTMKTNAWYK